MRRRSEGEKKVRWKKVGKEREEKRYSKEGGGR
jgi:hypothetical protein